MTCKRMGEMRNAYRILVGKHEGKRTLVRHRRRWNDNIRLDLRETGWEGVKWMHLVQDGNQFRAYQEGLWSMELVI